MTMSSLFTVGLVAMAALTGCAQEGPSAAGASSGRSQCFFARNVNGFGHATDASIDVQVGANNYYRLDLIGPCNDINWATGLVFKTTSGSPWVCDAAEAEILVPGRIGGRCLVTGVHPITKAQWQAPPQR